MESQRPPVRRDPRRAAVHTRGKARDNPPHLVITFGARLTPRRAPAGEDVTSRGLRGRSNVVEQVNQPRVVDAGRRMDYRTATPEDIAHAIAAEIGRDVTYRPVETDGAAHAAAAVAELL